MGRIPWSMGARKSSRFAAEGAVLFAFAAFIIDISSGAFTTRNPVFLF